MPFCETPCDVGQYCNAKNACVAEPQTLPVGPLTLSGLGEDQILTPSNTGRYTNRGTLPFPLRPDFSEGGVTWAEPVAGTNTMTVALVEALQGVPETVALSETDGLTLQWAPGTMATFVEVIVGVNNHGGTGAGARIRCLGEDQGNIVIPVELTDALVARGTSGFPTVSITRLVATKSTNTDGNPERCIDFVSQSQSVIDLRVPGLTSCSTEDECPDGQTCQLDLTCQPS